MPKNTQVNIRFDEMTDADLEAVAKRLGTSKSALVRHLTEVFLEEVKRTNSMRLDSEWVKNVGQADARSEWGDRKAQQADMKAAEDHGPPPESASLPRKQVKYPKKKGR